MASDTWRDDRPSSISRPHGPPESSTRDPRRTGSSTTTLRDEPDQVVRPETRATVLRLPTTLARDWRIERELASRGAEADLVLVNDGVGTRRVAKIYRAGIEPKTGVLGRLGGTSFEHVVRLFDHGQSDGRWYELLEYVEPGSVEDLIREEGPKLSEVRVREVLLEMVKAIDHLHRHEVVHRDIKPSNVLVRTVRPLDLVLTDFGIASVLGQQSRRFTTGNRAIAYAAPETAAGEVSQAADWWSLGIILVEMLTGRHPFAAAQGGEMMNDQAIMSRLFQMPVDRLVEGVADPWRTLCRGLLRREAQNRWGSGEIGRWLRGDTALRVTDEAAPGTREFPPFYFAGQRHSDLADIARAFGENWSEARKTIERGHLLNWVKDDLRDNEWRQYLSDLDRDYNDLDERVFRIIAKADPTSAPTFCGYRFDPAGLVRLARDSLANTGYARSVLTKLLDHRVLLTAAEITGNASLRAVHESWSTQLEAYRAQGEAVVRAGAPQAALNQSLEQARASMLLSVLPGGHGYLNELRIAARQAAKPELQDCAWFQALGDPSTASAQAAFLIPVLAPHAKAPAEEVRRARADAQPKARAARNLFLTRVGFGATALAGVVAWFLWYNSPANVAARQEEQRRAEALRQEQERQRQEQERQRQEAERARAIENARTALRFHSVEDASRSGCSQAALSATQMLANDRSRQNFDLVKDALSYVILVDFVSGNCLNPYFNALARMDVPGWTNIRYYYNRGGWPIFRTMITGRIESIRRGDGNLAYAAREWPIVPSGASQARDRLTLVLQRLGRTSIIGGGREISYSPWQLKFHSPTKTSFLVNLHDVGHSNRINPAAAGRVILVLVDRSERRATIDGYRRPGVCS